MLVLNSRKVILHGFWDSPRHRGNQDIPQKIWRTRKGLMSRSRLSFELQAEHLTKPIHLKDGVHSLGYYPLMAEKHFWAVNGSNF